MNRYLSSRQLKKYKFFYQLDISSWCFLCSLQIDLVYRVTFIVIEFSHIGQPFLIRHARMELSVQNILSDELWIVCLLSAFFVYILDSGFDSKLSTNSQNSLVIHVNIMIPLKGISDSTVSLVRTFHMNLFYGFCNHSVFRLGLRQFMMQPFVIGGTADTADFAKYRDWIIMFFMFFLDCLIYVFVAN